MLYARQLLFGLALLGGLSGTNTLISNGGVTTVSHSPATSAFHRSTQATVAQNNNSVAPEIPAGTNLSSNWAGYIADNTNTNYSAIGATWTVPTVANNSASSAASADATWVGIGGVTSNDLIQSGTQAVVQDGQVTYQAWVEMLPAVLQPIPLAVHAGDSVTVSLAEQSPGQWGLSFNDNTTAQSYRTTVAYNSSHSSAEWIEEMPVGGSGGALGYLPLDNFGSVNFENGYAVANGSAQSIALSGAQAIDMVTNNQTPLASTSNLDQTGGNFTVKRSNASAQVVNTGQTGSHWRRTGVGYRRYTVTSSTSSSTSGQSQTVINLSNGSGQGTVIPLSFSGGSGWIQILFR